MRYKVLIPLITLSKCCFAHLPKVMLLFALGLALASCKDDDQFLSLSTDSVSVSLLSNEATFTITSNTTWGISVADKWAKVDTDYGSGNATITITIDENDTNDARSTTLYVSSGSLTEKIDISQEAFTLSKTEIIFDEAGTPQELTITSEYSWTAVIPSEAAWCNADALSGSGNAVITLTPTAYTERKLRKDTIRFTCLDMEFKLAISQKISNAAPSAPTLLTPANNATAVAYPISFTWNPSIDTNGDVVHYDLLLSEDGSKWGEPVAKTTDTQASLTADKVKKLKKYYWRVIAKDLLGGESRSVVYSFTSADILE